jgi:lysine 6-dehydrogenase
MLVLGAGLQGTACTFDLLNNPSVTQVLLADLRIDHLPAFLAPFHGPRLEVLTLDVRNADAVRAVYARCDAVMSAIPYYFNAPLAALAVEQKPSRFPAKATAQNWPAAQREGELV